MCVSVCVYNGKSAAGVIFVMGGVAYYTIGVLYYIYIETTPRWDKCDVGGDFNPFYRTRARDGDTIACHPQLFA